MIHAPAFGTLLKLDLRNPDRVVRPGESIARVAAPYYEVTIQPEQAYLVKSDRQYPLQSGMEVTADIISREETVLTFILRRTRLKSGFVVFR